MSKIADLDLDHIGIIAALILYNPRTVFQSQSKNRSKNEFCDKKLVNITFDTVAESCLRIPEYSQVAEAICNHDDFSDILNLMRKIVQVSVCMVIEKNIIVRTRLTLFSFADQRAIGHGNSIHSPGR